MMLPCLIILLVNIQANPNFDQGANLLWTNQQNLEEYPGLKNQKGSTYNMHKF